MGLLTCQMPAWTNIDNVITSILQQYQRLFKLFKLFSLQSSLTEYRATTRLKNQASVMEYQAKKGQQTARCQTYQ